MSNTMYAIAFPRCIVALCVGLFVCSQPERSVAAEPSLDWSIQLLAVDTNEGVDLADVNRDGKLDVIAGRNWYAGPDFVPRPLRVIQDWHGYAESNGEFAYDINQDGWPDVVSGSFLPTTVHWYENPQTEGLRLGQMWKQHLLVDTEQSSNEGVEFSDLDADGTPEWIVNSWQKNVPMYVWKFSGTESDRTMTPIQIGPSGNGHGLAIGDVNDDGRADIVVGQGWYEAPAEGIARAGWTFHPDWDVQGSLPMLVVDVNQDGRNDLIVGLGHDFGLHWWQQLEPTEEGTRRYEKHLIDDSYSQPHCLHFADLDGDGDQELITGKRYYGHNGSDPGGQSPPCLYYYSWNAPDMTFERHTIDEGHVGTGLQIRTGDLNDDGRTDIAVAGKSGTYVILNRGPVDQ